MPTQMMTEKTRLRAEVHTLRNDLQVQIGLLHEARNWISNELRKIKRTEGQTLPRVDDLVKRIDRALTTGR